MPRRREQLPRCDLCDRVMNGFDDLTTMYGPRTDDGARSTLRICGAGGCWERANERDYWSPHQREQR